jgi:hypothetical protein
MPKTVVLGETYYLWERGFRSNHTCACGSSFHDCEFWAAVVEGLTRRLPGFDPIRGAELTQSVARSRHLPLHALRTPPGRFRHNLLEYHTYLANLFRCALEVTGGDLAIDSSKHVHGLAMLHEPSIDLYVVHMVRDPRAVAYSWSRRKVYEHTRDESQMFPQYGPLTSTAHWVVHNAAAELLRVRLPRGRYLRVRYEDLAREPSAVIADVAEFLQKPQAGRIVQPGNTFQPALQHSISGNPVRFGRQQKRITLDQEWRTSMRRSARMVVNVFAWPLLVRYGYISSRGSRSS